MEIFLIGFVVVIGTIVISSIINEKKLHIGKNTALVLVAFIISAIVIVMQKLGFGNMDLTINTIRDLRFDSFLLECVLCFILFANASNIHLSKFVNNIVPIANLSILSTVISTAVYGLIFYGISAVFNFNVDILVCLLLGCIIAPTEPIAIVDMLKKQGISKSLLSVMEGEALFSHGISITLFVFISTLIKAGNTGNFVLVLFKEIIGAILIGLIVSWILFKLIKMSNEPMVHILISLLTVALSVVVCKLFGVSGDIAAVVCGLYFTYQNHKIRRWKEVVDSKDLYNDFWSIASELINTVFFVLIGFSVIYLDFNLYTLILIPIAIILNFISRAIGVGFSTIMTGKKKIPSKYNFKEFISLMTCSGLRGVLSLILVLHSREILPEEIYMILLTVTMITLLFTTFGQVLITKKVYRHIEKKRDERALMKI
ncbi:MAG: cation:proton antiporter [Clostridia bacterium]|nr:cation:proton antiporter [Clostridia bacterium]